MNYKFTFEPSAYDTIFMHAISHNMLLSACCT